MNREGGRHLAALTAVLLAAAWGARASRPLTTRTESAPLKGQFLLSSSNVEDPRFRETVILIAEHGTSGALGLIVNKRMKKVRISELMESASLPAPPTDSEIWVHYGGPVELGHVFLLHSTDVELESSRRILDGVDLSTDSEMLQLISEGRGPGEYLLLLGYSGWSPGQLEQELAAGSWIRIEADASRVFSDQPEETWRRLIRRNRL